MPRRDMWFAWSRAAIGRMRGSSLELFIDLRQIYRLHASEELAIGGAVFRGADSGSFPASKWQIHGCIGCGTINLENSGARPSEKIFDPLGRSGKNGGSQTLLDTVAEQDRFVPIFRFLYDEYRTERFFLDDFRAWIITTHNGWFQPRVAACSAQFFRGANNSKRGGSRPIDYCFHAIAGCGRNERTNLRFLVCGVAQNQATRRHDQLTEKNIVNTRVDNSPTVCGAALTCKSKGPFRDARSRRAKLGVSPNDARIIPAQLGLQRNMTRSASFLCGSSRFQRSRNGPRIRGRH